MAKRFTDPAKWRDEWFRTLPIKAKLAWTFLCDECDHAGIWKADYGLASFQLDFKVTASDLTDWFGSRVHFFDEDKVLIVPFYGFQYKGVKDSWNAKRTARERLESLGFTIFEDKVQKPTVTQLSPDCPPTVDECPPTLLNTVNINIKDTVTVNTLNTLTASEISEGLESVYKTYPRKEGKTKGLAKLKTQIKTPEDLEHLKAAVKNYRAKLESSGTETEFIKHFSTWVGEWRDWIDPETGTIRAVKKTGLELWREAQAESGEGA